MGEKHRMLLGAYNRIWPYRPDACFVGFVKTSLRCSQEAYFSHTFVLGRVIEFRAKIYKAFFVALFIS